MTNTSTPSRVTVHMVASLDGFIARRDGSTDWLETSDHFEGGEVLTAEVARRLLGTIGCYVMGSGTYETALAFEAKGLGWVYGDTPTVVVTTRDLPRPRKSVEFYAGDLAPLLNERLRPTFGNIWVVGGAKVTTECLRRGLVDEVRYSIAPVLIGDGISFFSTVDKDFALHLLEITAYDNGIVALRYEVTK